MTESWDSDPDLIFPEGPLTLLHSDTEGEAETSGSSISALFSTGRQSRSSHGVEDEDVDDDWIHDPSNLDQPKDGTLRLRDGLLPILEQQRDSPEAHHLLSSSGEEKDTSAEDSFSSNSSSERQSTIKASLLVPPASFSSLSSNNPHPSIRSQHRIDSVVLSVLASGAKGTVTKLEPSKKSSPIQAGIDWDEDLVLPDSGLAIRDREKTLKTKASFASGISDEVDDPFSESPSEGVKSGTTKRLDQSTSELPSRTQVRQLLSKLAPDSGRVDDDFADDFELPSTVHQLKLSSTTPVKPVNSTTSSSSSSSSSSLAAFLEFDPKSTKQRGNTGPRTRTGGGSHRGHVADDSTPKVRNRPSLTPSLMTDRSSSPFTEGEDYDLNDGFFDDIEFPPEFGIPNNLNQTAALATPTPSTSKILTLDQEPHQRPSLNLQGILDRKMKARAAIAERGHGDPHTHILPSSSTSLNSFQSFPSSGTISFRSGASTSVTSLQSHPSSSNSTIYHRGLSSFTSQNMRRAFRAYEDREDERVEDGLEIDAGSLRSERLRSRTNSSMSSASSQQTGSHHHRPIGTSSISWTSSTNNTSHQGAIYQQKRMTVPFPSTSTPVPLNIPTSSSFDIRHTKASYMRSISTHSIDLNALHSSSSFGSQRNPSGAHPSSNSRPTSVVNPSSRASPNLSSSRPTSVILPTIKHASSGNLPHSAESLEHSRFRNKSLRSTPSNGDLASGSSNTSATTTSRFNPQPPSRIKSPLGQAISRPSSSHSSRPGSSQSIKASMHLSQPHRSRTLTTAGNSHQHSTSISQRVLKHKKSAVFHKNLTSEARDDSHSTPKSTTPSSLSPSTSNFHQSSNQSTHHSRLLARKRSMPSLSTETADNRHSVGGIMPKSTGTSSTSCSLSMRPKSRQERLGSATSNTSTSSSTISSSSRANHSTNDLMRVHHNMSTPLATIAGSPDRPDAASHQKRISDQMNNSRPNTPQKQNRGLTMTTSNNNSRLTMPTIASRLKAKPSIIQEKLKRGIGKVYGDGTELDEFDDLPTSKEKERKFTTRGKGEGGSSGLGIKSKLVEQRKVEGARRRAAARAGHVLSGGSKKGLIRQMSENTLAKTSKNSEMRWNSHDSRWEGNESVLRAFDNVLSSSSRPALITQLSTIPSSASFHHKPEINSHSSGIGNKAHNHTVGEMIFDSIAMCWRSRAPEQEIRLEIEIDESEDEHYKHELMMPKSSCGLSSSNNLVKSSNHHLQTEFHQYPECVKRAIMAINDEQRAEGGGGEDEEGNGFREIEAVIGFWNSCEIAEKKHSKEVKGWVCKKRKKVEERKYLMEIRKLVMDQ